MKLQTHAEQAKGVAAFAVNIDRQLINIAITAACISV